jgi:hypothetical protein
MSLMTLYNCRKDEKCVMKDGRLPVTRQGKEDPKRIQAGLLFTSRFKNKVSTEEKKTLCSLAKKHGVKSKLC